MAATSEIQRINTSGWLQGFSNLWKKENQRWWRTSRWWSTIIVWLLIVNGLMAIMLWVVPNDVDTEDISAAAAEAGVPAPAQAKSPKQISELGLVTFFAIIGMAPAVGAVIIGQETILTEKHTGTAAWVLTKPASRTAFVLAKFATNAICMLITVTIIQGAIAYGQLWLLMGSPLPLIPYLTSMGITFLALIFYLAFAMMLGTLFTGRGPGLGISLLFLFGYSIFYQLLPFLGRIMPWALTATLGPTQPPLAVYPMMGQPIPDILPIVSTAALTILFLVVALWRFHREEF